MKKSFFQGLTVLAIIALALRFGTQPLMNLLGLNLRAGLKVTSSPSATVFLNEKEMGQTPYQNENLSPGEYRVKLLSGEKRWQEIVSLYAGTLSLVNRDLSSAPGLSSGEILTLQPGKGVTVYSTPTEAQVEINGQSFGKSPLVVKNISFGEHTFLISHNGYLTRSVKANLPSGMVLSLEVDLATDASGSAKTTPSEVTPVMKVIVKKTPTGFLRVRSQPSLEAEEIARVSPGESLIFLEELPNWFKVQLSNGKEGYVSALYGEKKIQ